jgi:hypothetical protein
MFAKGHMPPTGWTIASGRLEEVDTIGGYAARHCEVKGRCLRQDCRRSCHFDYERLLRAGMADLRARKVMDLFKCARLDGCSLEFREEPERVITLGQLSGRDYVGVDIRCAGCSAKHLTTVEGLIYRLKAKGLGDASTSINAVSGLIRGPCRGCGAQRWAIAYLWCDPNRHPAPLWRQELQRKIDEAARRRDIDRGLVR